MIHAGALGYVTKAESSKSLLRAIDAVAHNRQYLSAVVAESAMQSLLNAHAERPGVLLSPRERRVISLVARGLSSLQIGGELNIAASTVDVHRRNIMRKLDLHTAVDLARYAMKAGMVGE